MLTRIIIATALTGLMGCAAKPAAPAAPAAPAEGEAATPAPEPMVAEPVTLIIPTEDESVGDVMVTPVYHGTVRLEHDGLVVWIDPWSKANMEGAAKADYVVITDVHFDHLDVAAIDTVAQESTVFLGPQAVADDEKMADREVEVVTYDASVTHGPFTIEAVPMYNLVRGPEEGGVFHDKGRGNGYVFTVGGTRLYFAGDTECTEEMKALTGIDHAFIPMNLPYTMPPEEAAECVKAFAPAKVTPIHYAGSDLSEFSAALAGVDGVSVVQVDAYPGGLPW